MGRLSNVNPKAESIVEVDIDRIVYPDVTVVTLMS